MQQRLTSLRGVVLARLVLCVASVALLVQAAGLLAARESQGGAGGTGPLVSGQTSAEAASSLSDRLASLTSASTPDAPPALSGIAVRRELDIQRWLRPGEFAWNDEGVAPGPMIVVVNIRARVLSVYRGGIEIGRSSLIYGADDKPTPTGTFPILEKDADHVSNLYDAPMPHMLRLTWDGVALHGSPELRDDLATRGCVGLPREFAALLFDVVRVGDRVVVWDGETPLRVDLDQPRQA